MKTYLVSNWKKQFINKYMSMTGGVHLDHLQRIVTLIEEIRELKHEKDVVILSHYYMPPELQIETRDGGVADFTGDSLGLSLAATQSKSPHIVFCGVNFMAETAYILNKNKKVLIPAREAGCTLAESVTGSDVKKLKKKFPGTPVIAYINTYAETKAECDICCTSRNALKIAASFPQEQLIFIPDKFMGQNLVNHFGRESGKQFILWQGSCAVHENFMDNIVQMAEMQPGAEVLLHWEVPDETVETVLHQHKGMIGSTNDILKYVENSNSQQFILGSECDLGATLKGKFPNKSFSTPCTYCHFMKAVNLENTLKCIDSIETEEEEKYLIRMDETLRRRAAVPLKKMMEFS